MGYEDSIEKGSSSKGGSKSSKMTLQKAVDMGEYKPDFLSTFPEWHELSRHLQFQFIRQGIDNRHKQLIMQYAEINNVLDFSLKPHLKEALENVHKQLKKLDEDREELYLEYSK